MSELSIHHARCIREARLARREDEKIEVVGFQVDGDYNGAFWRTKRRPQTKEISFQFFVGSSPDPSSEKAKGKDISLVVGRAIASGEARQTPMRTQKYKATTRSARWNQCLFSKLVRAKANISSQTLKPYFATYFRTPYRVFRTVIIKSYGKLRKSVGIS